jgi:hypothetical protein
MNHWKRIFIVGTVLLGGTLGFGFWAINEFDNAFSKLANTATVQTANIFSISSSTEILQDNSTSTESAVFSTSTISTTTISDVIISNVVSTTTNATTSQFTILSPQKGEILYANCGYNIKWNEPNTISSADIWIVNADTIQKIHPTKSNLIINATSSPLTSYTWWIGDVEPAQYYIFISKINGEDTLYRGEKFVISSLSGGSVCPSL